LNIITYSSEGFFQNNIEVKERHYLIFSTDTMLRYHSKAKTWYMDGLFKLETHFYPVLSINAFIEKLENEDHQIKQVPLFAVIKAIKFTAT
jgi:hypothetical protein